MSFTTPPSQSMVALLKESDKIWEDEAEKRLRSLRSGSARTVSADLVHEKANKIFDRS